MGHSQLWEWPKLYANDAKYQSFNTWKDAESQYVFLIFESPWIECMHILQEEK